jgi:branched-chain amino acid transport system ATP-binding protein/urea transport system ATP-binding protein
VLTVDGLIAGYQHGSRVLDGVSFHVQRGEIVALMGRNGMGKSTVLRAITGHLPAAKGTIALEGEEILGRASHEIANLGVGYVPQGREIFGDFTTEENLLMGVIGKKGLPNRVPDWAYEIFPMLRERRWQRAGTMSGGQQQQLAIMRALVGEPKLLLLDEPSEGIQPSIVQEIARTLRRTVLEKTLTVLLVEQNLELVLGMASRFLFMENGRVVDEAPVHLVRPGSEFVQKYLSV